METWKHFEANGLTHSAAHHLLAIREVGERYGGWARVTDIARALAVTRGSVSINLRSLKNRRLIETDEHRMVRLSPNGEKIVKVVLAKRSLVKSFLTDVLRVPEEQAEIDSCKIEHLISRDTAEQLAHLVRFFGSDEPGALEMLERFHQYSLACGGVSSCPVCTNRCALEGLADDSAPVDRPEAEI